jgi:hypothetical protein
MKEWTRLLGILCVFALLIVVVGCAGRNDNQYLNPNAKYYVGTKGIETKFVNVPPRLYYYGPSDPNGNAFALGVEVQNRGASFSHGGIYLSGYDPNIVQFHEVPISPNQIQGCGISIGTIGWGEFGGIFRCDGVNVAIGSHTQSFSIESVNSLISRFGGKAPWLDSTKFDFDVQYSNSDVTGSNFVVNLRNPETHLEYYQHGRLFIALFSGLDFRRNYGREFLLVGNTYELPGGEVAYFDYNGVVRGWPPGLDQYTAKLQLTSCYQYTTFADPIVCIDPDPYADVRKVCYPQSRTWNGGNGAPVAITSVEQENTPRYVIFRLNVKNIGTGTVYDPGSLEKCSPYYPGRASPNDKNVVYLGDVRIGNVGLINSGGFGTSGTLNGGMPGGMECNPRVIRLDPNTKAGTTTCKYPIQFAQIKSGYQTPLVVELWYGYSQTIERPFIIKRVE